MINSDTPAYSIAVPLDYAPLGSHSQHSVQYTTQPTVPKQFLAMIVCWALAVVLLIPSMVLTEWGQFDVGLIVPGLSTVNTFTTHQGLFKRCYTANPEAKKLAPAVAALETCDNLVGFNYDDCFGVSLGGSMTVPTDRTNTCEAYMDSLVALQAIIIVGVAALLLMAVLPALFLGYKGRSLIQRYPNFRLAISKSIPIIIWFFSAMSVICILVCVAVFDRQTAQNYSSFYSWYFGVLFGIPIPFTISYSMSYSMYLALVSLPLTLAGFGWSIQLFKPSAVQQFLN